MLPNINDFDLEVVIDKIGCKGGYGSMKPYAITIHHDGITSYGPEDKSLEKLTAYTKARNGVSPYHIYIPRFNNRKIYVANYLTHYVWHNNNLKANKETIAITLEGNFQVQAPTATQLGRLRWILDALQTQLLIQHGWTDKLNELYPQNPDIIKTYDYNKKVNILHWHNEVGKTYTACAGTNLIPKVLEYRNNKGIVNWGNYRIPDDFDNEQYLKNYPLVKEAVDGGHFLNGYDHYVQYGIAEKRTDKAPEPDPVTHYEVMVDSITKYSSDDLNEAITSYNSFVNLLEAENRSGLVELIKQVLVGETATGYEVLEYKLIEAVNKSNESEESGINDQSNELIDTLVDNFKNTYWKKFTERKFLLGILLPVINIILKKFGLEEMTSDVTQFFIDIIMWSAPVVWMWIEGQLDKEKIKK